MSRSIEKLVRSVCNMRSGPAVDGFMAGTLVTIIACAVMPVWAVMLLAVLVDLLLTGEERG